MLRQNNSAPSTVRRFNAEVTFRDGEGKPQEETFPVFASDSPMANRLAFAYVLQVLKLDEFELRVVGS